MATNDFLPFAAAGGANVVSQATYAGLAALSTGYQAGVAQSAQLNKTWRQSSIMAAVVAQVIADVTGQNAVDDGTTATLVANLKSAIDRMAGGSSRVLGLVGGNNITTPNTQFDLSAASVDFRNPTTGETPSVTGVATITNNILTAGPAANGRDQASVFTASSWVHFYFIFNPTTSTVATISSASAPPTGPTLPTGYTSWAYAGAVYLSSGSALLSVRFKGARAAYDSSQVVLSGGGNTTATAVSLAAVIPANALALTVLIVSAALTATAGGVYSMTSFVEVLANAATYQCGLSGTGGANAVFAISGGSTEMANVGQQIFYRSTIAAGAGAAVSLAINGYKMPNGGE